MRVAKTDVIAGLDAVTARDLARKLFRHEAFPIEVMARYRGCGQAEARDLLAALAEEGYVEPDPRSVNDTGQWWRTTVKGNALAQAGFGRPVSRAKAEELLAGVLARARAYNADPARLYAIASITVFGSYLDSAADRLGDVDLKVDVVPRGNGEEFFRKVRKQGYENAAASASFMDELHWSSREPMKLLRNRSAYINLTDEDITALTDRYRVVYELATDPAAIQLDVSQYPDQIFAGSPLASLITR
ncbi:hypothetical protein ACFY36_42990 [Actinoplanes sp. NPDC000266]